MKRIVCFLMALIMVLGMVPNAVVTANAYSQLSTSETAINVMLNAKFYETPTPVDGKTLLGYSTPVEGTDVTKYASGISQEAAVTLLRNYVKNTIDKEINNHVKTKNIDLTIGQHNAVALHMFRNKGTWNPDLKAAVTSRKTGNDMVAAFVATRLPYDVTNVESLKTKLDLSLCEAGLYLNGLYSMSGLSYALLDDVGGDEKADKVIGYVSANGYNLDAGTSLGWYVFDGTADGTVKGSPITKLTGDHNGKLIVKKTSGAAEYTINSSSMINLNVYKDDQVTVKGTLKNNTDFKVGKEEMKTVDGTLVKWVYGTGTDTNGQAIKGWINLGAHDKVEENLKPIATAVLKAAQNVHEGATAESGPTTPAITLASGVSYNIYEIKTEATSTGNQKWGKVMIDTDNDGDIDVIGWINLALATVEETLGESGSAIGKTGTVTGADEVNIRSSAAIIETPTSNKITALKRGTKVTVLEQNADGSWAKVKWTTPSNGYTQGWIYMHYVQMDNVPQVDTGASSGTPGTVKYTGVVTSNINLNVRKRADIYSTKVDSLPHGTKINVYETTTSRNMKWGRIGDDRWVCLTYVALTEVAQPEAGSGSGSSTSTTVQATVSKVATLDIHKNYNSNSQKLGTLKKGDVVTILERNTETVGSVSRIWGRIKHGDVEGWINLAYTDVKTVTTVTGGSDNTTSGATSNSNGAAGTVANCISVNIREAAGVYNAQITKLNNGTPVKVFERVTKDGAPWARITWNGGEGWVCMNYITMNTQVGGTAADGTVGGTNSNTISATGIVNSNIDLKVRSGAGLGNAQIGSLKKGTKVTVYEQVSADGMIWGRTPYGAGSGWICMSYVTVESTTSTGKGVMGTVARCFAAVNVRSAPGTNNALINKINVGSRVEVFETKQHGTMLWGRVAQGWVCMDYILLDSELPPGTILDATVPTTEATQPGETTEPENEIVTAGAVPYSFTGHTHVPLDIFNDANKDSEKVGSINAFVDVKFKGIKVVNTELWGLIDQHGTAGWLNMKDVTYTITRYVKNDNQAVYADNFSSVKGTLPINKQLDIIKLTTDGSKAYGWVEESIFGWVPMAELSDKAITDIVKVYKSGTSVGDGTLATGTTFEAMDAVSEVGGSKVVYKVESGVTVKVSEFNFSGGKIMAKVKAIEGDGWINMSKTNYSFTVTFSDPLDVRTSKDNTTKATDEENNIKGTLTAGSVAICQMQYDSQGNVWAVVTGCTGANAELNGHYVMIRNSDGTPIVGGLG